MEMRKRYCLLFAVIIIMTGLAACSRKPEEAMPEDAVMASVLTEVTKQDKINPYDTLNVATYLNKIGETYFIADCYHNQILYHDNLTDSISEWKVLTDEVHYAHTIAGDGTVLMIDDTENNRLLVFEERQEEYVHTQTFENVGMWPHYVQYDEKRKVFLAWSSVTGELYYIKRNAATNQMYIEKIRQIQELYGVYVRSFTVIEDAVYFVSGHNNGKIIKANLDTLSVEAVYAVPDSMAGMVQLTRIEDYYYITVSTDNQENQDYATIIRTKELAGLMNGEYEEVYEAFGVSGGTPYYISQADGRYYMAHHRTAANIIAFDVVDNTICNVEILY